jgi:ATP-dependent Clp protease ATP-binding subunit ClpB
MTSNLGGELILEMEDGEAGRKKMQAALTEALRLRFRPEFLNRIDETIIFERLGSADLEKILDIQIERLRERLAGRGISLNLDAGARALLVERGFDIQFGARPLKRALLTELENPLAKAIISGAVKDGQTLTFRAERGSLVF